MDKEIWVLLIVAAMIPTTSFVAFFAMRLLDSRFQNTYPGLKIFVAGISPSLLIVVVLAVWHYFEYKAYLRGPQEGWMGPLLFLIYGFPYFMLNVLCNFMVAGFFSRQRK